MIDFVEVELDDGLDIDIERLDEARFVLASGTSIIGSEDLSCLDELDLTEFVGDTEELGGFALDDCLLLVGVGEDTGAEDRWLEKLGFCDHVGAEESDG